VARALPRLDEAALKPKRQSLLERWFTSEIPERVDALLGVYLGKFFRRLKVLLLRFDNYLSERIKKLSPTNSNGNGKPKIDFSELQQPTSSVKEGEAVAKEGDVSNNHSG